MPSIKWHRFDQLVKLIAEAGGTTQQKVADHLCAEHNVFSIEAFLDLVDHRARNARTTELLRKEVGPQCQLCGEAISNKPGVVHRCPR